MPLIGTAGHVDHGKSSLIQRITGRNPDRLAEEKERGLTIDLGFAWTTLPDGTEVSFVDVPGHERFLKNMLAGIEAVDAALFVVAADEGWMPQSEEHLAVLDLLEVDRGVVAVTKVDVVDDDLRDLALSEVGERLAGSHLEGAPVLAVSAVTGEGVDTLLARLVEAMPEEPTDDGRPRLWVDRSFPIPGAGTIVTGSLLGSSLAVDDTVELYSRGIRGRVRALQSHERPHERVGPGRRVAVNLAGVDHDAVERGDMMGYPGQWELSRRMTVRLRPARFVESLSPRGAYQMHIGSAAQQVEIIALEDDAAVVRLANALPVAVGDRFILRDTGRQLVVGGGWVLDPAPGRTRLALSGASRVTVREDPDQAAQRLLTARRLDHVSRLRAHSGGGEPAEAVTVGDRWVEPGLLADLSARSLRLVRDDHAEHPLRVGLPIATLAERLGVEPDIAEVAVDQTTELRRAGPDVALTGHDPAPTAEQENTWRQVRERLAASLSVPEENSLGIDRELLHLKLRSGELVRISDGLVYLPSQIDELKAIITGLGDQFTVAEFRDAAGLSRKYAVPILEWSDKEGLTVRRGDHRSVR